METVAGPVHLGFRVELGHVTPTRCPVTNATSIGLMPSFSRAEGILPLL